MKTWIYRNERGTVIVAEGGERPEGALTPGELLAKMERVASIVEPWRGRASAGTTPCSSLVSAVLAALASPPSTTEPAGILALRGAVPMDETDEEIAEALRDGEPAPSTTRSDRETCPVCRCLIDDDPAAFRCACVVYGEDADG